MTKIKHDIWVNLEGLSMLCFSGDLGNESRELLEPNSKIIHSFFAESHFEAMTIYYHYMDLGSYESEFEIDKIQYNFNK